MSTRFLTIVNATAGLVITALALFLITSTPAPAQCWWECGGYRSYDHDWRWQQRRHTRKVWRHHETRIEDTRCQPSIAVVGDQYVTEDGARAEADKQFSATVRYMFGERAMDRSHARDVSYECGRSSIGSVAGQVFYRCRITARPCSAPKQRGN